MDLPPFATLARYFPQFALALDDGIPANPNSRILQAKFSTTQVPQPAVTASFSTIIPTLSVFGGATVTIDPTNALAGNPLKTISDTFQAMTSGITVTFVVRGPRDYSPLPDETPLQSVEKAWAPFVGKWAMRMPENVKAQFTLQSTPPAAPLTAWIVMTFFQLATPDADPYLAMPRADAIAELRKRGILLPAAA